jgi:signal transduction histidine kinase/DNA-binding NarL/FixJ family response regulator/HPt (histidine-containing phosphotransfer) domain-containing protein
MLGLETFFWQTVFNLLVAVAVYSVAFYLLYLAQGSAGRSRRLLGLLSSLTGSVGTVYLLKGLRVQGWGMNLVEMVTVVLAVVTIIRIIFPKRGLLKLCLGKLKILGQGLRCGEESLGLGKPLPSQHSVAVESAMDGIAIFDAQGRYLFSEGSYIGIDREVTVTKQVQKALQQQLQRALLLKQITDEIRQSLDLQEIFEIAAEEIGKAFQVSRCLIRTYEENQSKIPLKAEYIDGDYTMPLQIKVPLKGNIHLEAVLSRDRAIATDNVDTDPLFAKTRKLCQKAQLKSILAIRTSYQGEANGLIGLHQCDYFRTWTTAEIELIEALASQLGIAIAQANLLRQERQQRETLRQINQDLAIAKQEAEAANRAKSEFLATMTHELRTPMNAVIGMTQLLQNSPLTPQQQELINTIGESGEILLKIINDLLDFSKIESGKLELQSRPFNLLTCLEACLDLVRPNAEAKYLDLSYTLDPDTPTLIMGDEMRLRQILLNLLSNAVKFTPAGKIQVTVTARRLSPQYQSPLSPNSRPYTLRFTVQDTGIGIPEDGLERLFQSFSQVDSSITRDYGGTGLGLAIAQRLCELMGGRIWVETELGKGSTFSFAIIVTVERDLSTSIPAPSTPAPNQQPLINASFAKTLPLRILLAEDVVMNQKVALMILKRLGYSADVANNGIEVLTALHSQPYDVVFMDIQMPKLDGLETTKRIRQDWSPEKRPRIIAMTARAMVGDREECFWVGMDDYVSKPIQLEALMQALKRCGDPGQTQNSAPPSYEPKPHPTVFYPAAIDRDLLMQPFKDWETEELAIVIPELITTYLDDAPTRFQAIQQAIITSDGSLLYQTAHTMRSSSQMLGATHLAQYLAELEINGRKEQLVAAKKTFAQFQSEYQRVVESLHQICQEFNES